VVIASRNGALRQFSVAGLFDLTNPAFDQPMPLA
jgi:hypothetical protein